MDGRASLTCDCVLAGIGKLTTSGIVVFISSATLSLLTLLISAGLEPVQVILKNHESYRNISSYLQLYSCISLCLQHLGANKTSCNLIIVHLYIRGKVFNYVL